MNYHHNSDDMRKHLVTKKVIHQNLPHYTRIHVGIAHVIKEGLALYCIINRYSASHSINQAEALFSAFQLQKKVRREREGPIDAKDLI